jgi:pyruvate,water dikinase
MGNKALGLEALIGLGLPVPRTYVCTSDAYEQFRSGDPGLEQTLRAELGAIVRPGQLYAVRSSTNIEDDPQHSFAGQFKSFLNMQGVESVWKAIQDVWASTQAPTVTAYQANLNRAPVELKAAVLIQEMVQPQVSGVAFSRNPMTDMDEVVVEAVAGSGEALVQDGVTPERWVNKWGDWIARPGQPALPVAVIQEVVDQTKRIAKAYGQPVDLEWVYDGATVHWLQVRPITALANVGVYSDKISREVLPGQIKPLVWSINVPLVNSAWVRLFTELIGPNNIDPTTLARAFHYRAYFNMGAIGQVFEALGMPRDSLELLMGIDAGGSEKPSFKPSAMTYRHTPRMLRFVVDKWRFARQVETFLPPAQAKYRMLRRRSLAQLTERELLAEIDQLYELTSEAAYFNIVTPLLMGLYDRLLAAQLAGCGVDAAQVDVTQGLNALRELDPTIHLEKLNRKFNGLTEPEIESLAWWEAIGSEPQVFTSSSGSSGSSIPAAAAASTQSHAAREFHLELATFVERFGHLSNSGNDFSSMPWRENPELLLKMIAGYGHSAGRADGSAIRPANDGSDASKRDFDELPLPALRRPLLTALYRRARSFRLFREQVSSLYTFGYGLFRDYFLALGDHFVRRGVIATRPDIFYLYLNEVREIVTGGELDYTDRVAVRQKEMDACRDVALPSIIYGNLPPPIDLPAAIILAGTPTSRGYYQGPVRVIAGLHEFDKLQAGDVLVIPFSDVGWTPLFAKAGAVIAESGGILSHSSIIAREYNIPAVVSVPGACRLRDGTVVTVDGYGGRIAVCT